MSDFITAKVTGLEELDRKLRALPVKQGKKVLRKAMRAGAKLFQDAVVHEAPHDTGFLRDHFTIRTSINAEGGHAYVAPNSKAVYPKNQSKFGKKPRAKSAAMVARFKEFGTSKMKADPFMTRAFESSKSRVLDKVISVLRELLNPSE